MNLDHSTWMRVALKEAQKAFHKAEVPIGAVIVHEGRIVGKGHNLVETLQDPTAHAEMLAIAAASNSLASWRLDGSILYTTVEPCPMCAGAILLSRISLVVYGAQDPRYGAAGSAIQVLCSDSLDVKAKVIRGVYADQSQVLLRQFFQSLRKR